MGEVLVCGFFCFSLDLAGGWKYANEWIMLDFHGLDAEILQKALAILVKRGKAQVFGQEDQQGVKFF